MENIKYESVIILKPNLSEENKSKIKETVISLIDTIGHVTKFEDLGIKKLAYAIKGNSTGCYVIIEFNCIEVEKIERKFRTLEEIMKFIIVKQ